MHAGRTPAAASRGAGLSHWTLEELAHALQHVTEPVIGIDMSKNSPSVCRIDTRKREIAWFFVRQHKHDLYANSCQLPVTHPVFAGWTVTTHCWEVPVFPSKGDDTRFYVYKFLLDRVISVCSGNRNVLCAVENYSYASSATMATTELTELGGCLRFQLFTGHGICPIEIPPMTVKKCFSGKGNAKKDDMWVSFLGHYLMPNLCSLVGTRVSTEKAPKPVDDMVDAFAVALTALKVKPLKDAGLWSNRKSAKAKTGKKAKPTSETLSETQSEKQSGTKTVQLTKSVSPAVQSRSKRKSFTASSASGRTTKKARTPAPLPATSQLVRTTAESKPSLHSWLDDYAIGPASLP